MLRSGVTVRNQYSRNISTFPVILHDSVQCESLKPHGPPASVTWLQLLRKQTNTGTSTALTVETPILSHTADMWHQPTLCGWSWRLFGINPAIHGPPKYELISHTVRNVLYWESTSFMPKRRTFTKWNVLRRFTSVLSRFHSYVNSQVFRQFVSRH